MPSFYEFFAGGGMARAGLGDGWECLFANDFDKRKCESYKQNWGEREIVTADVGRLRVSDLPKKPDLVWASFPCQDLSLAGGGAGLQGNRSGTFWPFWKLMQALSSDDRLPKIVVLENVIGALTSHSGNDFRSLCSALVNAGFIVGAVVVDAALFLPHSRPRLFIIGMQPHEANAARSQGEPTPSWHTRALRVAYEELPADVQAAWRWWSLPRPLCRRLSLSDIVEDEPSSVSWHSPAETANLLSMMAPLHKKKVDHARSKGLRVVGTVYRRTRIDENGCRVQRAEVRFDDVAGCLRTPAGGSSRQTLIVVERGLTRSRLVSARETARLMGLPDSYVLPSRYNEAYHLTGDGVAVPVVSHIADHLLRPALIGANLALAA